MPTKKEAPKTKSAPKDDAKTEEFVVDGKELLGKVKEIIEEGNARKITIYTEDNKELLSISLTWAAVGTILAPYLAAIGAIVAIVTKCRIVVEKK